MKRVIITLALLSAAGPATAQETCKQPKIYTNADLGRPLSEMCRPAVSEETLASLKAHQFNDPPTYRPVPYVPPAEGYVAHTPWEWPEPAPRRRLDGTLLSDPVTVYGSPFVIGTYPYATVVGPYGNPRAERPKGDRRRKR